MDLSQNLAESYASYLDIHLKDELRVVEGTVDEMLTRLDEFENVLSLLRSDRKTTTDEVLPEIHAHTSSLEQLFTRVDKLEALVNRVDSDLNRVEAAVDKAETDLASQNAAGAISSFLKPLFSKNASEPAAKKPPRQLPNIDPDSIYSTDDLFSSSLESDHELPASPHS